MSRRPPNPNADRAAANQQTLKTLVKLESNKSCADCKRNKHPRWASWNLGIFVCIRCSGIHRGMGTHISRVKSVDLDAWTDEQLASMLRWGNARANRYWEEKLAPGHVPSEAKIENFIRTKYDSKRWVMDGPMPDPSTLDVSADDEVPLNVVKEKARLERSASLRTDSAPAAQAAPPPSRRPNPDVDLFGDPPAPGPSTSTKPPATITAPPQPQPAARAAPKTGDSLLGFDFFGNHTQAGVPGRPASAAASVPITAGPSRPDLKQSILSLYATNSRTSTPAAQPSATPAPVTSRPTSSGPNDISSDFGSLNFGASLPPQPSSHFSPTTQTHRSVTLKPLSGGNFFDSKPLAGSAGAPLPRPATRPRELSSSSGFGAFESATSPGWGDPPVQNKSTSASNGHGALFDFAAPSPPTKNITSQPFDSAFNLSASKPSPPKPAAPMTIANSSPAVLDDPWGSSDAWATPAAPSAPAASKSAPKATAPTPTISSSDDWGWGNNGSSTPAAPPVSAKSTTVTADEDFGGWESSLSSSAPSQASKPAPPSASKSFASNDADLFSNVWG